MESEFSGYYCSENGRPGVSIRKKVGLMLLKNIYDLSAKEVVARWMENPYMQYFTGCCICYTYNHSVSSTEGFADTLVKSIEGGLGMEEAIEAVVLTCEESSPE